MSGAGNPGPAALDDPGIGLRAAVAVSAALHLALLMATPAVERLLVIQELPDPPPMVQIIEPPPEPEVAEQEPPPEPPSPPIEEEALASAEEQTAKAPEAEEASGAETEQAQVEAAAPPPVAAVAGGLPPPPTGGGNAERGEEKMQGPLPAPPAAAVTEAPPAGAPDDIRALGAPLGEEVTVPAQGEAVTVAPGVPPGVLLTEDSGQFNWGPYLMTLFDTLNEALDPRLPATVALGVQDPVVDIIILRDGTVDTKVLRRSSGDGSIDRAVLDALGQPMPPLPAAWPKPAASLANLRFDLSARRESAP